MVLTRVVFTVILIVSAPLAVVACGENNTVSGTITFDGEPAIPEGAVLEVELRDVSYQDAAAPLIANQTIASPERFPVDFAIPYDPDDIDPRAVYGLQVSITLNGRLIYANDTAFDVLTRGNPRHGLGLWVIAVGGGG